MPTFTWRLLDQGPTRYDFDNPENHASERGSSITGRSDGMCNRRCRDYARPAERLVVIGPVFRRL